MTALDRILTTAKGLDRHIILSEGDDPRVAEAARRITGQGLARITLMNGPEIAGTTRILPAEAPDLAELADHWHHMRAARGMTGPRALEEMRDPIRQAAMRVRLGQADGTVGGAVATTADTVRAALQIIGRAPDASIVSSFFLMEGAGHAPMIFADCALVIMPEAEELAAIARAAAQTCRKVLGAVPRVALLSFSTAGSAEHSSLKRIREARDIVRATEPGLEIDGEIQFDAALDPAVRMRKAPDSPLSGPANVFVFPDLASGNIGYKIAQRLGGLSAVGPVLQGMAKPANDLSRGCDADDIVAVTAITALQSAG